jgi:predicted nucleic acid-binding protein
VKTYVDSSVVLRHILNDDSAFRAAVSSDAVGSSDLLAIECQRVLQRERMAGHLDDHQFSDVVMLLGEILDRPTLIEMGPAVKRRAAGAFPTVIGTLDAIHLASAILWRETEPEEDFRILTQDRQLALCARALGIAIL